MGVALVALLVAAPPAAGPPPPVSAATAAAFAAGVSDLAELVAREHPWRQSPADLVAAAAGGLYAAAGEPIPAGLVERLRATRSPAAHQATLAKARSSLGDRPALAGHRAYLAAAAALARAADPYCGLTARPPDGPGGCEEDFGVGFELAGVGTPDWLAFVAESAERRSAPAASPLPLPWRVSRVLPGSPAADAGLRPGDRVTSVDELPVTAETGGTRLAKLIAVRLALLASAQYDGVARPARVTLGVVRDGRSLAVQIEPRTYTPASAFGFRRRPDGTWDHYPDAPVRVAYIRVGYVEAQATAELQAVLKRLADDPPAGVVLDLRWCDGGTVSTVSVVARAFLPPDRPVARLRYTTGGGTASLPPPDATPEVWKAVPLAVLVGPGTAGGGEMIAAALQDHGRATVIGSRTAGKAVVLASQVTPIPGVLFRLTKGLADRPTGVSRQRLPTHGPLDEWGVRPDRGGELPVTPDLSARLRAWAEWQALRRPGERAAAEFDDPLADPQRAVAVRMLGEKLKK